jgi:hypothetical protein
LCNLFAAQTLKAGTVCPSFSDADADALSEQRDQVGKKTDAHAARLVDSLAELAAGQTIPMSMSLFKAELNLPLLSQSWRASTKNTIPSFSSSRRRSLSDATNSLAEAMRQTNIRSAAKCRAAASVGLLSATPTPSGCSAAAAGGLALRPVQSHWALGANAQSMSSGATSGYAYNNAVMVCMISHAFIHIS